MSAEKTDEKSLRRRGLRRQAEVLPEEPVDEVDDEVEDDEDDSASSRGITEKKGRPTPSRRTQEVEVTKNEGNFITRTVRNLREYVEGVRSETDKVVWPTREEARRLTGIVLSSMIAAALVLGIITLIFNELFTLGTRAPLVFGIVFVVVLGAFLYYLRNANRRTTSF
jgi:preprotein translocase SecE subunit